MCPANRNQNQKLIRKQQILKFSDFCKYVNALDIFHVASMDGMYTAMLMMSILTIMTMKIVVMMIMRTSTLFSVHGITAMIPSILSRFLLSSTL